MSASLRKEVAQLVDVIRWSADGQSAAIECPGGPHADNDGSPAMVWLSPVPHAHCFHESCRKEISNLNQELAALASNDGEPPEPDPAQKALWKRLRKLRSQAERQVRGTLEEVSIEQWLDESPLPVRDMPVEDQFSIWIKNVYKPDEIVWTGEKSESGDGCELNFRTAKEWAKRGSPYGQLVSAYTFKPEVRDTGERTRKYTLGRKLLVLESDVLTLEQFGGVVRWMGQFSTLRSLVLTGGKSMHAAFHPLPRWTPKDWRTPPYRSHKIKGLKTWPERERQVFGQNYTDDYWSCNNRCNTEDGNRWRKEYERFYKRLEELCERDVERWKRECQQERIECQTKLLDLYAILQGLGCDRNMLTNGLTTRCPGVERLDDYGAPTGHCQELIYLNPITENETRTA